MAKLNSKNKGNSGERECAKILNDKFGNGKKIFSRTLSSGAWSGGKNRELREDMSYEQKLTLVSDIMTPMDFKYVIEHKFYKSIEFWDLFNSSSNLFSWMAQVEGDAAFVNKKPMLVVKINNKKRIVFLKEETENFIFKMKNGWYCLWLEDLLNTNDTFFFDKKE